MRSTKLPSILGFSTVLTFYGGKLEMRRLLLCLAKGGRVFYQRSVKHGHIFKVGVRDANLIHLNNKVVELYLRAKKASETAMRLVPRSDKNILKQMKVPKETLE